ncbi:2-oxoacid:acceptor oxidoreductase subunit alpha [Desulfolutivibrio sulfoxidireducens]|uniref:2-oxoacid:acceptor oxidoreductase subunit alpha n=1 Tax=Desulfolutivibrio sulfoxidireducens TaxID=2773299 RepID=UPI00159E4FB0|nr:2-oxoacid:acceptor oxidoreductase subunit alpha [Desulfolutivibrio sulfoxidireducens]QLA20527.1 2-oxoacid:acceptor oxidoreductase subunit alpha [Desulfolutivibrio sulfoxidireducens]
MSDSSVNILIGGEAGQGLVTVGDFLSKALVRAGYEIVVTQDYMSRIRGGHNTYAVRVGPDPVSAPVEAVDILVALDAATYGLHAGQLSDKAVVIIDAAHGDEAAGLRTLRVPFKDLCPRPIYENMAALGVLCSLLCLDAVWISRIIRDTFAKKGEEIVAANLQVFEAARAWTVAQNVTFTCIAPAVNTEKRIMVNGNEAIALGAMAAGVNFCSFYPMTPGTSVALTLAAKGQAMGVVVEQAEDEIAAVNMALGASFAGATALVPTSGGGFALMVEGISLSGMIETPVVIVVAMRPGPATGLPTRTEQADLNLVLYAGHGEFPRAVFAPGTVEQCFHLTHRAVHLAEKYQGPTFVLTDQFLADSYRGVPPFDPASLPLVARPGTSHDGSEPYERYTVTDSGVSPRLVPGFGPYLVVADSDEHTPDGHITEDLSVRVAMQDKRSRKLAGLRAEAFPPDLSGDPDPDILLTCWGTTLGAALEAAAHLRASGTSCAVLHFSQVSPLVPDHFLSLLQKTPRPVMIEGNSTGQLARLIRQETGFAFPHHILRYDGLPFTARYILDHL